MVALLFFLYEQWVNKIWPEIRVPVSQRQEDDPEEWTPIHPQ